MVEWLPEAQRSLQQIDSATARRMLLKAQWLEDNLSTAQHQSLEGPLKGFYKLRVGQYRILYMLDESRTTVQVHLVGHRREIYKS